MPTTEVKKDAPYHRDAITYNTELADLAEELSERVTNPEVTKWCLAVMKQHRFHQNRHQKALDRLENRTADVDYRDAGTGQYVTEEYAEQHPDTTIGETVEHPDEIEADFPPFKIDDAQAETEVVDDVRLDAIPRAVGDQLNNPFDVRTPAVVDTTYELSPEELFAQAQAEAAADAAQNGGQA